jgi:hypothetical protein
VTNETETTADIILETAQANKEINSALTDSSMKANDRNNEISRIVVGLLHRFGYFYHVINKMEFGSVYYFDKRKKSLLLIQSDEFNAEISERFGINRASPIFKYVMAECETEGLSKRATSIKLSAFWERKGNNIYITNSPGTMIKVTKNSIGLVDNGTDGVLFPKGSTLKEWTYTKDDAKDPFETCELFKTISTTESYMKTLFKIWVLSHPTNPLCKPPLCATGSIGSGKTRLLIGVHELWGTPGSPEKCQTDKKGEEDFWILEDRGGFLLLDNVDSRISWLADAIATASTGGSSEKRTLHTNNGITKLEPNAWCSLTSANPKFAADAGISDRLMVVRLNRRTGETKETALKIDILNNRNSGLSWVCQTLSKALADTKEVPNQLNARHPDFADMAVRIGRQFTNQDAIVEALTLAEMDKSTFNMENDDIGATIKEYFEQTESKTLTGTAGEIVQQLKEIDPDIGVTKNSKGLTAKGFGNRLKTIMPHLETLYGAEIIPKSSNKKEYIFYKPGTERKQQKVDVVPMNKTMKQLAILWNQRKPEDRMQAVITALVDTKIISKQMEYAVSCMTFEGLHEDYIEPLAGYFESKGCFKESD